ncbi:cupin-like domain-containing protein [Fulvimonas sp. R45]|uniref:cupin-like domain-containing protein n=1 Tax=Fulvimonas sp. R45 TaxID=3045937 RepID=UPI00265E3BFC|nr:cupin-like domain-containing protein [Fulvimonas sp. R45]MDO1530571.1 cupin-like domain-containing protein [Fulvimonas sp. R45]
MSEASGAMPAPAAIEEYRPDGDRPFGLDDVVGRERPLVIRGLVRDWPIVQLARQSDTAFAQRLAQLDSGADVSTLMIEPEADGIIGYTPDLEGFCYRHFKVPLTLGLQRLASYSRREHAPGLVIQSAPVRECIPGFLDEHALPFLDPVVEPRLWIGNRVTTPTHFDSQHNIACVVCGTRRFTLFPPEQLPNLYIGPLDFAPTGAAISMARLDRPDDPRFPRLKQALASALVAELHPGDAIYMPPLWWHNVDSLERLNALVNYWWSPVQVEGFTTGHARAALYHCLLAFRALPPTERADWKRLLDHYVFGGEDAIAHIPEPRRGVLGPLTPETVEQLKQGARQNL